MQNTTVPPEEDKSALTGRNAEIEASNQDVIRATGTMAIATLLSRITGFLRQMLIGATLGATVGTAFSSANQIPNLVTEIVLGAVLTSLVVPVLVRAEKEDSTAAKPSSEDFLPWRFPSWASLPSSPLSSRHS